MFTEQKILIFNVLSEYKISGFIMSFFKKINFSGSPLLLSHTLFPHFDLHHSACILYIPSNYQNFYVTYSKQGLNSLASLLVLNLRPSHQYPIFPLLQFPFQLFTHIHIPAKFHPSYKHKEHASVLHSWSFHTSSTSLLKFSFHQHKIYYKLDPESQQMDKNIQLSFALHTHKNPSY